MWKGDVKISCEEAVRAARIGLGIWVHGPNVQRFLTILTAACPGGEHCNLRWSTFRRSLLAAANLDADLAVWN